MYTGGSGIFNKKASKPDHEYMLTKKEYQQKFGAEPLLDLKLRLGEGTGAALAMSIVESSLKIYNEMATFSSAGVSEKDND